MERGKNPFHFFSPACTYFKAYTCTFLYLLVLVCTYLQNSEIQGLKYLLSRIYFFVPLHLVNH